MQNALCLLLVGFLTLASATAGNLPDCWFTIINKETKTALTTKDIRVLPPPAFTSITTAYWEDVGMWTVKLSSSEPIPGDASGYVSINGHVTYPPLMRQKPGEPTVFAFCLPTHELAQSYAAGLARLHKISSDAIKAEEKHKWP